MTLAETVFRLEQLDSTLEGRTAALRDLQRRRQRNVELEAAHTLLEELERQRVTLMAESRAADADLAETEARITRTRGRLYGGTIVDSRELASLEHELAHLAPQRDAREERCLDLMEQIDTLNAALTTQREEVERQERAWEQAKPRLASEARELSEQITTLRADREPLAASLDPQSLSLYTRLRASLGHAVAPISNGVCGACRVSLPPRDIQHARGSTLAICPNCRRILYSAG
jgi:predicted  nucleic acid-binding Zn-ribbon protein